MLDSLNRYNFAGNPLISTFYPLHAQFASCVFLSFFFFFFTVNNHIGQILYAVWFDSLNIYLDMLPRELPWLPVKDRGRAVDLLMQCFSKPGVARQLGVSQKKGKRKIQRVPQS